jgi:hypothetical protein
MRFDEFKVDEAQVWARTGKKVTRKFRCNSGSRKGRIVKSMAQCYAAPDPKKRAQMKKTRARLGKKMARKARRTKRINPASKIIQKLNKAAKK